ncbi:hypothetical protein AUK22_02270 [bacterium CG2_30_54_10]|nr:MAG: hypothetical protein AUK22_02270 [bacterium CG2_30_54_10]
MEEGGLSLPFPVVGSELLLVPLAGGETAGVDQPSRAILSRENPGCLAGSFPPDFQPKRAGGA